jgi:hypothetical protein
MSTPMDFSSDDHLAEDQTRLYRLITQVSEASRVNDVAAVGQAAEQIELTLDRITDRMGYLAAGGVIEPDARRAL